LGVHGYQVKVVRAANDSNIFPQCFDTMLFSCSRL